ncbi:YebC-like protein [Coniochaeta ligniaria NRRL 30616]|uniref:YebC-like protein n=1 Tax=Coniochaeta ligniaria NRRL 30616 TaxID=1408157 RepID=A0A1J7JVC2_9PEZI|nr:YebC-like protein [Coniochaeta ligniaria NRRL 30616]
MGSVIRGISPFIRLPVRKPTTRSLQCQCLRSFTASSVQLSGHNKWSKIKHEKGAADKKRSQLHGSIAKLLTLYSKLYGSDPQFNPLLVRTVVEAKKSGMAKDKIESAVARGQGRSTTGQQLKKFTFEAIFPPDIAVIVEAEGESTARLVQDLNLIAKKAKAKPAASKFFFKRMGRAIFEPPEKKDERYFEKALDLAVDAGAEEIDEDAAGNLVVWSDPELINKICETVGLKVLSADIVWTPEEETKSKLNSSSKDLQNLIELLAALREYPDVLGIYANVSRGAMTDEEWAAVVENLDN